MIGVRMRFKHKMPSFLTDSSKGGYIVRDGLAHRRESADEPTGSLEVSDIVMSDLQRKFAHVQWRKHANDEKIREAIELSKRMNERDLMLQLSTNHEGERERWTEAIVRDELTKPAQIDEVFLRNWETQAKADIVRRFKDVKLHLESIKRVERALKSKRKILPRRDSRDGGGSVLSDRVGDDRQTRYSGHPGSQCCSRPDDAAIEERLKRLQSEIMEKHRELRRAGRQKDFRSTGFTAKGFKTGRGR